ncbi:hypothetical protein V8E51_018608 [Hyaloscypha variabilis]
MLQLVAEEYSGVEGCVGTLLFSDIGKRFYSEIGWKVLNGNRHLDLPVTSGKVPALEGMQQATPLLDGDLKVLCEEDEAMIRKCMVMDEGAKTSMVIVPDVKHMEWHHMREDFICERLFGNAAKARGAMAGEPRHRVWIIWMRKYDGSPDDAEAGNVLYILRLVIEGAVIGDEREKVKENLKAVIGSAQKEAKEWKLSVVRFWDPNPLVRELVKEMGLDFVEKEREDDGIASLRLNEGVGEEEIEWLANERYAWL